MIIRQVHECSYLEATIGDAFHLSSGIMHSFSPDAPGVITDGLQPQQTCIGKRDLHKVCSTSLTRSVMKNAVNLQMDHQPGPSRSGLKATKACEDQRRAYPIRREPPPAATYRASNCAPSNEEIRKKHWTRPYQH